jgi:hypothetical protein
LRLAFELFGNEGAEMARFVAVSREAHAQKVWRRFANYQFAAKDALAPIVLAEVVHVGSWMPVVFVEEAGSLCSDGDDVADAGAQPVRGSRR